LARVGERNVRGDRCIVVSRASPQPRIDQRRVIEAELASALRALREMLVDLHPVLAGAASSLVLLFAGADAQTTIITGLAVGAALQLLTYISALRPRSECERGIARAVRSILDRHLVLTRIDAVGFGDFLTLRHLAAAARVERIDRLVSFGGSAHALAGTVSELTAELEDEVGRCYHRLRSGGQMKVDAFAATLRRTSAAAAAMLNAPTYDPEDPIAASRRIFDELADALRSVESAGDDLDHAFDDQGSRAAAKARATSAAEQQRREGHAAAVLLKNAREAAQVLQLPSVQHAVPLVELPELIARLRWASELMQDVEAEAFHEATDDARHAHRRLRFHDLGDAIEAATRLAKSASDAEADAVLRHRLARFPNDLATLEAVRDGRAREVAPWPGFLEAGTPTLRAQ
jgi:hypothetical protein